MSVTYDTLRQELLDLESQLKKIVDEAEALLEVLHSPGPNGEAGVGLTGNLVDSEGFPRADIDVYQIRQHRNRLACLKTDRKELEKQIEAKLHQLHQVVQQQKELGKEDGRGEEGENASHHKEPVHQPSKNHERPEKKESQDELEAIAVVDQVMDRSPAEEAGLQVGDRVIQFGKVKKVRGSAETVQLKDIGEETSRNFGKPIKVTVLRDLDTVQLTLTPRQWEGRGALGCHLMPL